MDDAGLSSETIAMLLDTLNAMHRDASGAHEMRALGREPIRRVIRDLQALLFPEFLDRDRLMGDTRIVTRPYERLTGLIHQVLVHQCPVSPCPSYTAARALSAQYFQMLPSIRREALTDVQAAFEGDPAAQNIAEIISTYPGFYATLVYRLAHRLHQLGVPLLPRMMTELAHSDTGIDIHPGATIGSYFFIDHGTGVVIGETTEIGDRVTLYQGVTLGALNFPHDGEGQIIRGAKRHPTIEHDVVIYSEATILGGATVIGHDSVIGGNVWLTEGVPPFSKVTTKTTIALRPRHERLSNAGEGD